jgi:transcriptional regulator with XRE-family HTH domain
MLHQYHRLWLDHLVAAVVPHCRYRYCLSVGKRRKSEPRRELAAKRLQAGYSQARFADAIGASMNAVRAWEQGWSMPMPRYRQPIAAALGVSLAETDRLLDGRPPVVCGHDVPAWMSHYESLVQAAGGLAEAGKSHVPPLLQTKAYAAAIERCGPLQLTEQQIIERVDLRLARQSVLFRPRDPLKVTSLVTEHVLRSIVGDPEVMIEQLDHLVGLSERPNIGVRVLPADGSDACALGGFELLTRPGESRPFMAVDVGADGPRYVELPESIERFIAIFDYLDTVALSPADTFLHIQDIKESHR